MLEYDIENKELEYNLEPTQDFGFEAPKTEVNKNYEELDNLPKINDKEIKGNLTTEDLGITDIELITKILPESIEEDLKPNQVYNGNAIHDLARLFGMEMQNVYELLPQILTEFDIEYTYEDNEVYNANAIHQLLELFVYELEQIQEGFSELYDAVAYVVEKEDLIVTATFTLATQKFENISDYYDKIKKAHDSGRNVKLIVTIAENGNQAMADLSILDLARNSAFFYPIMKTNIGNGLGEQIYFFDVKIAQSTGSLTPNVLQTISFGE